MPRYAKGTASPSQFVILLGQVERGYSVVALGLSTVDLGGYLMRESVKSLDVVVSVFALKIV